MHHSFAASAVAVSAVVVMPMPINFAAAVDHHVNVADIRAAAGVKRLRRRGDGNRAGG
jgi:hypothetical protein